MVNVLINPPSICCEVVFRTMLFLLIILLSIYGGSIPPAICRSKPFYTASDETSANVQGHFIFDSSHHGGAESTEIRQRISRFSR
jgi:hypothetical protein